MPDFIVLGPFIPPIVHDILLCSLKCLLFPPLQMLSLLEHMYHELGLVKEFSMNPITLKRWLVLFLYYSLALLFYFTSNDNNNTRS